ncbi:protein of unknown function [Candidatus Nitrosocosmicus franklandus]|uniref:Uncharacterized protein n=1 Tax=Candidatus Nitrosocosmicus franklandianus TaxID=1798806 RepID=A0A484IDG0_9ARCH|nr:protein of unknown function [Candidatus Nitrosocosmicus franklandus]
MRTLKSPMLCSCQTNNTFTSNDATIDHFREMCGSDKLSEAVGVLMLWSHF